MKLKLTLPIAQSVNHMYGQRRDGTRYKTDKATNWHENAQTVAKIECLRQGWEKTTKEILIMEMRFFYNDARRRDTNNQHKQIADALEKIVYDDDRHVLMRDMSVELKSGRHEVEITVYKERRKKNERERE